MISASLTETIGEIPAAHLMRDLKDFIEGTFEFLERVPQQNVKQMGEAMIAHLARTADLLAKNGRKEGLS